MKEYIATKMNLSLQELEAGIKKTAQFYNVEDFDDQEKIPLFILARVRDLNDDGLNLYKRGSFYEVSYNNHHESILADDNLFSNLYTFFDRYNLQYIEKRP